jgi:hypothetical protein
VQHRNPVHFLRILQWWGKTAEGPIRAFAIIYSWGWGGGGGGGGGGGVQAKNFRMTKKMSEYFMAYEATKVFAIRKMETQFTNTNTHILHTDILQ